VKLRDPVQVVFVYGTAAVDPDGTEHFIADAYQLDARVEEELARLSGIARPGSGRPEAR
jgi:murein L,D-transpeptidase YcbB/YkuD